MNNYSQIKKTINFHRMVSIENQKGNDYFRVDRSDTSRYFDLHSKWEIKVADYLRTLRQQGFKVVHADICGRTNAHSLGADKSFCFSFKTSEITKALASKEQVFFDGDLFNSKRFSEFISLIKQESPALVTFNPMAGLQSYGFYQQGVKDISLYKKITYQVLINRLHQIIEVVRPGGFIFLEKPFQFDSEIAAGFILRKPQNQWTISLALKKIARKMKCTIEISSEIGGPYFLLKKRPAL